MPVDCSAEPVETAQWRSTETEEEKAIEQHGDNCKIQRLRTTATVTEPHAQLGTPIELNPSIKADKANIPVEEGEGGAGLLRLVLKATRLAVTAACDCRF